MPEPAETPAEKLKRLGSEMLDDPDNIKTAELFLCEVRSLQEDPKKLLAAVQGNDGKPSGWHLPWKGIPPRLDIELQSDGTLGTIDVTKLDPWDSRIQTFHYNAVQQVGQKRSQVTSSEKQVIGEPLNFALLTPDCSSINDK